MDNNVEVTKPDMTAQALARYSPSDAAIAKMQADYMPLVVSGEDDKAGCAIVRAARLEVKQHRVAIEHTRKDLKEDALRYGQAVDAEARRLTGMLAPIEDHLQAQEDIVAKAIERKRIAAEEARKAAEAEAQRIEQEKIAAERAELARQQREHEEKVAADRAAFEANLAKERAETDRLRKIEEDRLAEERKAHEQRLALERAEADRILAEQRAAQEAEARKLAAEREAIEREKREQAKREEIKAAEEAAAKRAQEEMARKAEAECVERERQEAEAKRREEMRPVNEKLRVLATHVRGLDVPEFAASAEVRSILLSAATAIDTIAGR